MESLTSDDDSQQSADETRPRLRSAKGDKVHIGKRMVRETRPVPFSPKHHETNRIRSAETRGKKMSSRSSSGVDGVVNGGFKRTIEQQSQEARMKVRRLAAVTDNIVQMSQRTRRGNASGIIQSIKLYNFMCHKSFYQEWHENLNFVVGENGSGKSALLSGLIIGLGGRALSTSRTSCVRELIKTGETHAKTEVVLLNKGKLPVGEYGEEITIQRIIDLKGHSTYKLQFGAGAKFKPATKIELDNILRLLDIQLENPVVILNQEYARSFLRSKDPKDKYKLFEDGVGTAQCDSIRSQVHETLQEIDQTLGEKKEELERLEKEYREAEERVKLIDGISTYQAQMDALNIELKWYFVQVEEAKVEDARVKTAKDQEALEKAETNYRQSLERKQKAETESEPNASDQEEKKRKKQELMNRRNAIANQIKQLLREKTQCEMKFKSADSTILKHAVTIDKLEKKIREEEKKVQNDREELLIKYTEEKRQLSGQIEELKSEVERLEAERRQFREGVESIRRKIDDVKSQREGVQNTIAMKERQLRQVETSSSSCAAFGPQMEALVDKVQANRKRFSQVPRGPLGACVTVKEAKYVDIIQFVLRNHLADFVVDNQKDAQVLNNLINQCFGKSGGARGVLRPSVHVIRFHKAYDVSRTNCSAGLPYPTILDMLEPDNNDHVVINSLIEISSIERILLFKDNAEALSVLSRRETVPQYCRLGFSLDFFKITPDPNLRCDAQRPPPPGATKYLKTSHSQLKRNLQIEVETLRAELDNYTISEDILEEERRLVNEVKRLDNLRRTKHVDLNMLKQQLQNLKEPPNRMADLASVKEELEEKKREKETLEEQVQVHREAINEKKGEIAEAETERANTDAEVDHLNKELVKALESQMKKREEIEKLAEFAERWKRNMEVARREFEASEKKLADVLDVVRQMTQSALELGDRVEVTRGSAEIKKEHDLIKAKIEHLSRFAERNQFYRERYRDLRQRYSKYKKDFKLVSNMFKRVKKYFVQVNIHYLWARDKVCEALKTCYESVASSRKYHGKIEIDHNTRELFYLICPDQESLEKIEQHEKDDKYKSRMVEYAAGLSGGERSFSTICFIIAMWQAMKSPFYMLDEFDVFMDAQNRKVSQDALMTHAKEFENNQFFFFTPLDLTRIPSASEALILRLYPPERNANEESLPTVDGPDIENAAVGSSGRKRGRSDGEVAGPSKARRL